MRFSQIGKHFNHLTSLIAILLTHRHSLSSFFQSPLESPLGNLIISRISIYTSLLKMVSLPHVTDPQQSLDKMQPRQSKKPKTRSEPSPSAKAIRIPAQTAKPSPMPRVHAGAIMTVMATRRIEVDIRRLLGDTIVEDRRLGRMMGWFLRGRREVRGGGNREVCSQELGCYG